MSLLDFQAMMCLPLHALRDRSLVLVLMLFLIFAPGAATSAGLFDDFMDPMDGQIDVSDWLLKKRGFLLNPFVITEPAIGYGGGFR